jgi:hypothetical protein
MHARGPCERRVGLARHGEQGHSEAFDDGHDRQDFVGFAGVREREDRVVPRYHADVAVAGFAGMHEKRGGAGARERGRDFPGDMPRFPHARDDDPAAAVETNAAGARKIRAQSGQLRLQALDFDGERSACGRDQAFVRKSAFHA